MSRFSLWAGLTALALAALVYASCSSASSQEVIPTPAYSPLPSPSRVLSSEESGPPQVEAAAPIRDPTVEPSKPMEAEVVYIGPRDVKAVALTFDTGVHAGRVPEVLDTLKEHGAAATFGITGEWAVTNPDLLKRIVEEGHAVINHSWDHASFTGEDTDTEPLTVDQMSDELRRTEEKIQEIAEVSTKPYFRPPYGDYDQLVNQVVRAEGYEYNVLWLIDSMGWEGRSAKYIVNVTLANAFNGAIFLYHTDNPRDAAALEEIIEGLNERGLQMVTIPQLLAKEPLPTLTPTPIPTPTPAPPPTFVLTLTPALAPPPQPVATATPTTQLPTLPTPTPTPLPLPTPAPAPAPTPTPAPTAVPYVTLAYDGFESGSVGGGEGWFWPWSAAPFVVGTGAAHSGSRYLDMASTHSTFRLAAVESRAELHLRFWARFSSVDPEDAALVRLSEDGVNWTEYSLFSAEKNDNAWHPYDIVVPFPWSPWVIVEFRAQMDALSDLWHIDDVELAAPAP